MKKLIFPLIPKAFQVKKMASKNKMHLKQVCCIFNYAPHYRASIYKLMDSELECDFYFGEIIETSIKKMDTSDLKGFKSFVRNQRIIFNKFYWQKSTIRLVFKGYKYFILTGDTSILSNWVILGLCLLLRRKVFLWMHGLKGELNWKGKLLTYPYYYMAHKILLYSEYSKQLMIQKGFREDKLICIYNSLDYNKHLAIRKKLVTSNIFKQKFNNNWPVLIFLGRLQKSKKINLIIEAMGQLKENNVDCNLVLVGSKIDEINYNDIAKKYGLERNIWFYGACYDELRIGELIYNADITVSPGNVGLTAIHSLSFGTPVITHGNFSNQMPEFEAIKPGITGDFFNEGDVKDLAYKITKWINLDKFDRDMIRKECYAIIDSHYNPNFQIEVLKKLIPCINRI